MMAQILDNRLDLIHRVSEQIRELKSSLQQATKPEITPEFLIQIKHLGRETGNKFLEDWKRATQDYVVSVEADHIRRGLGSSTVVTSMKMRAENDALKHQRAVEHELDLLYAMIDSKSRLLDPTIA